MNTVRDNRLPITSGSIRIIAVELMDPENVGLAVGTAYYLV